MLPGSKKQKVSEVIIAISAWAGLTLQLYLMLANVPENGLTYVQAVARFFSYYTILTNLLVAINLSSRLLSPQSFLAKFFSSFSVHTAIMLNIFLVGLGYNLLLRNTWKPEGVQRIVDELLHVVVPGLYFLYWLIIRKKETLRWKSLVTWLGYPFLYICYALIRGAFKNWYPYYFIDVSRIGYIGALKNCFGLLAVLLLLGAIFIAIANASSKKQRTT